MRISRMLQRMLLVVPCCLLLSAVTWGQSWGPPVRVGVWIAPARVVRIDRRWEREREWREHEWRERHRSCAWRRWHRRKEWRERHRGY